MRAGDVLEERIDENPGRRRLHGIAGDTDKLGAAARYGGRVIIMFDVLVVAFVVVHDKTKIGFGLWDLWDVGDLSPGAGGEGNGGG